MQPAVQHAIASMHARYFEPITLNTLASEVYVSPFHFSRVFAKATGVTPGRYLTAIRLFEAKRLLLTTSLSVSDVVCSVGYSSVGTFTTRFTKAVQMTPSQYRDPDVRRLVLAVAPNYRRLPSLAALREAGRTCARPRLEGDGVITARLTLPLGSAPATVLVGAFSERIPQCGPVAFSGAPDVRSTELSLTGVPSGRFWVIAVAEHPATDSAPASYSIGTSASQVAVSGSQRVPVRIPMRPLAATDAPIAITLATRSAPLSVAMANQASELRMAA